jgi:Fur family zinc uptake transcriptional regulator
MTRNQKLVFEAVESAGVPQSAYDLLGKLRPHGIRAPLQIYRALEQLVKRGLVHKLESISAFVACQHPAGEGSAATVFLICDSCGCVRERTDACVSGDLRKLAGSDGFSVAHSSIELHGHCGKC